MTANQTFSWNAAARASYYAIQISTLSSFSPLIINDSNITGTTFNTQILSSGTQYYWRVKAINNGGSSSWTTPWNFTTIYASPSVPVLVSPVDGATRIPVSTVLRWNKTANATVYQLQLSKTNDFSSTEIDSIGLADTSLAVNSLNQETVYYWRVRGKNADSTGSWSAVRSFTTLKNSPGVPVLILPINQAANVPVNATLVWSKVSGAASYTVQLSTSPSFADFLVNQIVNTDTSLSIPSLPNDKVCYWRVQAENESGPGGWSVVDTFTTIIATPSKVTLVTGVSDTITTNQITLCWHPSAPKILKYRIEIATNENMENAISDTLADTSIQLTEITDNTRFWWRVSALNDAGWGEFSEKGTFFISLPVSIRIPEKFGVMTLGAGNMRSGIRFSLPVSCRVKICLYDFKGSLVHKMMDTDKKAGIYTAQFPALSSGAYYMQFVAGSYRYSSKLILTR